jgi:hypothetical protein
VPQLSELERPLVVDCSVKRVEPGRGMGVSLSIPEDQSQKHFHEILASLTGKPE